METTGLLFIPDISGFTRFVKAVEIEHSRLIIKELLEILLDSNETGLVVSEIEGDAILFYKFGERPALDDVYRQVEKMFTAFHKSLIAYEERRYCQCSACLSAIDLTLKVITHYGEFTEYNVRNFNKLIGKDVIVAHQLLKNDIQNHEYWLVTSGLLENGNIPDTQQMIEWVPSHKITEDEDVHFYYAPLGFLKTGISVDKPQQPDLSQWNKVSTQIKTYDTDPITLLHIAAEFSYRNRWMDGVQDVEIQNHCLPRIGMRCTMTLRNGKKATILANHYTFDDSHIAFSEIDEQSGDLSYYRLESVGEYKTQLTCHHYIRRSFLSALLFRLYNGRVLKRKMEKSLENITRVVDEVGDSIRIKMLPVESEEFGGS